MNREEFIKTIVSEVEGSFTYKEMCELRKRINCLEKDFKWWRCYTIATVFIIQTIVHYILFFK